MKYLALFFLLFFIYVDGITQKAFQYKKDISFTVEDGVLSMPFAGGINSAQLQTMDSNGDGEEELVIWDINARNLLILKAENGSYISLPQMPHYFPTDINGFLILADFDGDGKKDLFTSSPFGIKAYQNTTPEGNRFPEWEVVEAYLRLDNGSNLQANNLDIPVLQDIDGDSDLDLVTFNFASGDYLEFYLNTSMERKGIPDIDGFAQPVPRWGGFEFCGCDQFSFGETCSGNPISRIQLTDKGKREQHAGGHSLLLKDFNGDGILDMVMGQDECHSLYFLANEGSNLDPDFNQFSKGLPELESFPEFPLFHTANSLSNDGLVITTNTSATSVTAGVDFGNSLYYYNYTSDNGYQLSIQRFLQEDMVDLGENSRPYFRGNRNNGDLIVTANTLESGQVTGKAFLFRLDQEGFTLSDADYLNLSSLNLTDLQYLEITNMEQSASLFVSGMQMSGLIPERKLLWDENRDGLDFVEINVPGTSLQTYDHFDWYSEEGNFYLLLARQTGELIRYSLDLEDTPQLTLLDRDYLGFSDSPAGRNLSVHAVSTDNQHDLYAVDQGGILTYIPHFTQASPVPQTELIQLDNDNFTSSRLGRNTWISSILTAFGDKGDLILGNTSGGLLYLEDVGKDNSSPGEGELRLKVYPNPTAGIAHLLASEAGKVRVINSLGQILMDYVMVEGNTPREINTQGLSKGIYLLQFEGKSGNNRTLKLIVIP